MATPNSTKPAKKPRPPKHKGGGWYRVYGLDGEELPDSPIKGRAAAYEFVGLPAPDPKRSNEIRKERRDNELDVEERRSRVAALLVRKVPYRQIAEALKVSIGTVASDVEKIRREWRDTALDNLEDYVVEELATLDNDEYELRMLLQRHVDVEVRLKTFDRILRIRERRAKLLGLDAPTVQKVLLAPDVGQADGMIFRAGGNQEDYVESLKAAQGGERRGVLRAIGQ